MNPEKPDGLETKKSDKPILAGGETEKKGLEAEKLKLLWRELKSQVEDINKNTTYTKEVREDLYLEIFKKLDKLVNFTKKDTELHSELSIYDAKNEDLKTIGQGLANINIQSKDNTLIITFDDMHITPEAEIAPCQITLIFNDDLTYTSKHIGI